jgi:hypothetical protein
MAQTTIEKASECPICGHPGERVSDTIAPTSGGLKPGTRALMVVCRNDACRWSGTPWVVQVNPDNTVPVVDHSRDDKVYPGLLPDAAQEKFIAGIQRQLEQEQTIGGGEVRNPNSER